MAALAAFKILENEPLNLKAPNSYFKKTVRSVIAAGSVLKSRYMDLDLENHYWNIFYFGKKMNSMVKRP